MCLGLMVLRKFIGTIYHEAEIHESGAFLEFGHLQRLLTESDRLISIQAAAV
jgi:hypothetical protein